MGAAIDGWDLRTVFLCEMPNGVRRLGIASGEVANEVSRLEATRCRDVRSRLEATRRTL